MVASNGINFVTKISHMGQELNGMHTDTYHSGLTRLLSVLKGGQ